MMWLHSLVFCLVVLGWLGKDRADTGYQWPEHLSEWQLYQGRMSDLAPAPGVVPYSVNAPLYSDYASKARFIRIPAGKSAMFDSSAPFMLPNGTILVKNFFYPHDLRHPDDGRTILETRLLVRDAGYWHGMTYVWDDRQEEAFRTPGGTSKYVSWNDEHGRNQSLEYLVPDVNQCKNCHNRNDALLPLGIKARQLNGPDSANQLLRWKQMGMLTDLPGDLAHVSKSVDYLDPEESLESRARSYLDANCGHCHAPWGSARTSGLYLQGDETNLHAIGVMKPPVAAGRGSGGRMYNIVPGKPSKSIIVYRMESDDPGVRMPEINRQIPHKEGIALIKEWIKQMRE